MSIQINELGDTCTLTLSGRLNRFNFTNLRLRCLQQYQKGFKKIVLNMIRVVAIDPTAMDTVVYLHQYLDKNEGFLVLVAQGNVNTTVRVSAPNLPVFESELDALHHLKDRTAVVTEIPGQRLVIIRRETSDFCELVLQGDLEITTVLRFKETWQKETLSARSRYLLNMTQLERLDSSGIGSTVVFFKNVRKNGGKMVIVCREHLMRLFQMSGMKDYLAITVDDQQARNYLRT